MHAITPPALQDGGGEIEEKLESIPLVPVRHALYLLVQVPLPQGQKYNQFAAPAKDTLNSHLASLQCHGVLCTNFQELAVHIALWAERHH